MVKAHEFSSQIPLPQTTGGKEWQHRGTICNIFECMMKAFLESTSWFLRNSVFSTKLHKFDYKHPFCPQISKIGICGIRNNHDDQNILSEMLIYT